LVSVPEPEPTFLLYKKRFKFCQIPICTEFS